MWTGAGMLPSLGGLSGAVPAGRSQKLRQRLARSHEIDCVTRIGTRRDRRHSAKNLLAAGRHVDRVVSASNAGPAAR